MLKKEDQARIFAKIKAIKRACLLSFNIQKLYQNFKIKATKNFCVFAQKFFVAGVGFEPTTSRLCLLSTAFAAPP